MVNAVLLLWIADMCGVAGMCFFLFAEVKQVIKIRRTHRVTGISLSAYICKVLAIMFTSIMLIITSLYMSLFVVLTQMILVLWVIYLMKKYKKIKETKKDNGMCAAFLWKDEK